MEDTVPYKRNFLKSTIVRVDFAAPVESVASRVPPPIEQALQPRFPKAEPQEIIKQALQISAGKPVQQSETKHQQWIFHGPERNRTAALTDTEFSIEYRAYMQYSELREDFANALRALGSVASGVAYRRLGIRFVNVIDITEPSPLDWSRYIGQPYLSALSLASPNEELARALTLVDTIDSDRRMRIQFGMNNPDYPAAIRKKVFVLDLDATTENVPEDISACLVTLDRLGKSCCDRFEGCIKQDLRDLMGGWVGA